MRIRGKVILFNDLDKDAEIELPSVDVSKIKKGDEVWVKRKVNAIGDDYAPELIITDDNETDIIAHFSKEEREPKSEKIKVPEKFLQSHFLSYPDTNQIASIMIKINQLIDCLVQIKERIGER